MLPCPEGIQTQFNLLFFLIVVLYNLGIKWVKCSFVLRVHLQMTSTGDQPKLTRGDIISVPTSLPSHYKLSSQYEWLCTRASRNRFAVKRYFRACRRPERQEKAYLFIRATSFLSEDMKPEEQSNRVIFRNWQVRSPSFSFRKECPSVGLKASSSGVGERVFC